MDDGRRMVSPTLVGRDGEIEQLVRLVLSPPAVVLVEGEAGVGKTRLVTELADRPELVGMRRLWGGCRRIREPFPLGPVVEAVRGQGAQLAGAELSPVTGVLRPLLPELGGVLAPALPALDDRVAERHRTYRALVELLAALGQTVLVLDDLHWAEEQTVEFLDYLLATAPRSLAVVLTLRSEGMAPDVRALAVKPPAAVARLRLLLPPLDVAGTGTLAAAILNRERIPEEPARLLWHQTAGLPLALEELLALLHSRGDLPADGTGWVPGVLDRLDVPIGIRDQVWQRVSRLSGPAREAVAAAAVLQTAVPPAVLLATCQLPAPDQAEAALAEALAAGVLVESPEGIGLRHPLAAQAVYEALSGPLRRVLHRRATTALAGRPDPSLGQLAHHLRQAGDEAAWVVAAERAAAAALAVGHDGEVVRLLEDVLRSASLPPAQRGRLAVMLSRAAIHTRHPGRDLVGLLATVLREELAPVVRGELRLRMGMLLEGHGDDFGQQRTLYAEAAADLDEIPHLQAQAMLGLGVPRVPGVPLVECRWWLDQALGNLPRIDDAGFQAMLRGKLAMVMVVIGDPHWRGLIDQLRTETGGAPRDRQETNGYVSVGQAAGPAGHLAEAEKLLSAALAGAEASGSGHLATRTRAHLAVLDYCLGRWDGLAERVAALTDQLDFAPSRIDLRAVAGCLALARGDLAPAARWLTTATRTLVRHGGYEALPIPTAARIRLALGRGRPDVAAVVAGRFLAMMDEVPPLVTLPWAVPAVTEAWCAAGHRAEAAAVLARWARELAELDAPLAPAAVRHARGFLASAAGRWLPAARHFTAAATRYEGLGCPYYAAQAWQQAAFAIAAGHGTAQAAPVLRSALSIYQGLGASWDYARAARAARPHGIPVPPRHRGGHRGYPTDLSPRERQVAELAAIGRTNKDIGAELFVSANTVKKQLTAAMRKLGVRTRSELAYQLVTNSALTGRDA